MRTVQDLETLVRLRPGETLNETDAYDVTIQVGDLRGLLAARRALAHARRALHGALGAWCPRGNPGGDGADGETFALCSEAIQGADAALVELAPAPRAHVTAEPLGANPSSTERVPTAPHSERKKRRDEMLKREPSVLTLRNGIRLTGWQASLLRLAAQPDGTKKPTGHTTAAWARAANRLLSLELAWMLAIDDGYLLRATNAGLALLDAKRTR